MKHENKPFTGNTGHVEKQTIYKYSNIIVSVFALVVFGQLVDGEDMLNKGVTDKLIARLDALGWLHLMHELGSQKEFDDMVKEMLAEGKPWSDCIQCLGNLTLYMFDGVEGMVRKRDAIESQLRDEARTGMTKKAAAKLVIEKLFGKDAVKAVEAAEADAAESNDDTKVTLN